MDRESIICAARLGAFYFPLLQLVPAVLLVTDTYDKGWRAKSLDNGAHHDFIPADHAFIGIPLDAGEHHILLEYRPRTLSAGLLLRHLACGRGRCGGGLGRLTG